MVTSTKSMSDLAQTVSCARLPQRRAARTERSPFTCSTSASSAAVNCCWIDSFPILSALHEAERSFPDGAGENNRRRGRRSRSAGAEVERHLIALRQPNRMHEVSYVGPARHLQNFSFQFQRLRRGRVRQRHFGTRLFDGGVPRRPNI